jgi:heat shock protein HtpX
MMNQLKTIFLLGVLTALLVGAGSALSPGHTYTFLAIAAVMNLGAYFFSDKMVLRMSGAREVAPAEAPELHAMVEELAARAGIPKPRVCIMDQEQPNAFATGRNPKHGVVAVTTGIMHMLEPRELRAVLAHEIGHIAHRDILISSIAAVLATAISYLGQSFLFSGMFGGGHRDENEGGSGIAGLFLLLLAPLAATLVQLGISRSREFLADQGGAELSGEPEMLARALHKLDQYAHAIPADVAAGTASLYIVNPLTGGQRVARLFSTHPSTEERVERLMALAQASRGMSTASGRGASGRGASGRPSLATGR